MQWFDIGYLSSNGVLDTTSQTNGSLALEQGAGLAPGASYTITSSFTTTNTTAPGNYTFFVKTDGHSPIIMGGTNTDGGNLVEASETNNTASATVVLSRPDLTVSSLIVNTIVANQNGSWTIPVTYTVKNIGNTTAQMQWFDIGYLSSNGVLDNTSQTNGSLALEQGAGLAPGASYMITSSFTTTTATARGTYTFFVKTDGHSPGVMGGTNTDNGNVVEASESNNTASKSVVLQ
jgi:hypothetical protein